MFGQTARMLDQSSWQLCFGFCLLLALQGCSQRYTGPNKHAHDVQAAGSAAAPQSEPPLNATTNVASAPANDQSAGSARPGMVFIKGGTFLMGTDDGMPDEAPVHQVAVKSFWMDAHEITVAEFAKFVAATNYQTDAEKFGWSGVFNMKTGAWENTGGANWTPRRAPFAGPAGRACVSGLLA